MNLRPRSDLLYVLPEAETYHGNLALPETRNTIDGAPEEGSTCGIVARVGPDCEFIKVGDKVLHTKWCGTEFQFNEEKYLVMHETDLIAVVEPGAVRTEPKKVYDIFTDTNKEDMFAAYGFALDAGYQGTLEEYKTWRSETDDAA